jgi:hypothetical protein
MFGVHAWREAPSCSLSREQRFAHDARDRFARLERRMQNGAACLSNAKRFNRPIEAISFHRILNHLKQTM